MTTAHIILWRMRRAAAAAAVCLAASALAQTLDTVRAVGAREGAIVVRDARGAFRPIAAGGAGRALPVWSPDGGAIAFVQRADRRRALSDLVVTDGSGHERVRVAIEPVRDDIAYAGMRHVEELRWLDAGHVAVRGSLNPSQSQYYVVDISTGRTVAEFIDDASAAAFHGTSVAYQTGAPHFASADRRAAVIWVDGQQVYPLAGSASRFEFPLAPRWSADGRSLAWLARDVAATVQMLVVWRDGAIREHPVALAPDDEPLLFWSDGRWVLKARGRAWATDPEALALAPLPAAQAVDPLAEAAELRARLATQARAAGVVEPDFWCADCPLQRLPRRSD